MNPRSKQKQRKYKMAQKYRDMYPSLSISQSVILADQYICKTMARGIECEGVKIT